MPWAPAAAHTPWHTPHAPGWFTYRPYCCGNLFADGGVTDYTRSLRFGLLPPGLSLTASLGRITGTPTASGVFCFLARVHRLARPTGAPRWVDSLNVGGLSVDR